MQCMSGDFWVKGQHRSAVVFEAALKDNTTPSPHNFTKKYKKYSTQHRNFTLFIHFMLLFIYLLLYSLSNIKRMIIYEDVTINWLRTVFEI